MFYYLSLGTNLGQRKENLKKAYLNISNKIGRIIKCSAYYCTEPEGFKSKNFFLNSVICVKSKFDPYEVLQITQEIEKNLGRKHKSIKQIYHDRIIDIDIILAFDDRGIPITIHEKTLEIPHPRMTNRLFVLLPLHEIAPDLYLHSVEKTVEEQYKYLHNVLIKD